VQRKVSDKAMSQTDTTETNRSQEAYGHSSRYEMKHCLWNPKFPVQNSQPVSTQSHFNPFNNYQSCLNIFSKNFLLLVRSRAGVSQMLTMLRQGWKLTTQTWSLSLNIKLVVEFGRRSKQPKR